MTPFVTSRRRFLSIVGAGGAAAALPVAQAPAATAADLSSPLTPPDGWLDADEVARTYYRVLLHHTRWVETQWNGNGRYRAADFGFAVVLGNAVLLTRGTYDAERAGVDKDTLRARTLATINHFAATNRLAGGTEWGRKLFWDTTFQPYFVLAARLLWADLDEETRPNVDTIARGQAAYTTALGTGNDPPPAAGPRTAYRRVPRRHQAGGDGRLRPVTRPRPGLGARRPPVRGLEAASAAGAATRRACPPPTSPTRPSWTAWRSREHRAQPPRHVHRREPRLVRPALPGGALAHLGPQRRPLPRRRPPAARGADRQPNGGTAVATLLAVMSDAGEPLMPMVADREHLYGRDVIPLAFLAQVLGDRAAARAEAGLAERLVPTCVPAAVPAGEVLRRGQVRAGGPRRAGHQLPVARVAGPSASRPEPLSPRELFELASRRHATTAPAPGLSSHQSPGAWSGAVSKSGFVKFAWQPAHDDWLFDLSGATPMFLPSTGAKVTGRSSHLLAAAGRVRRLRLAPQPGHGPSA